MTTVEHRTNTRLHFYGLLGIPPAGGPARLPIGPSIYYVSIFSDLLGPTHPQCQYIQLYTVVNVSKNCHFLNPPTHLFCWGNIWMVPILNCPSSNTYRHFTNIPWMNEKKESQFFGPNIHKFFATFFYKTHLQDADYGHHSSTFHNWSKMDLNFFISVYWVTRGVTAS